VTVPSGTILYHARSDDSIPTQFEWLAFDSEFSYPFCMTECYMLSLITTRPLRLVYFDGSSAGIVQGGPLDVQDLLIWNHTRPDKWSDFNGRGKLLCEWGKHREIDGFVRMQENL